MAAKLRLSKLQRELLGAIAGGAILHYNIRTGYSLRIPGEPYPRYPLTNTVMACFQRKLLARSNGEYVVSPEVLSALA
jgi:hypothetical protein